MDTGTRGTKGKAGRTSGRRGRGFAQAGGLITAQLGTLRAQRGYALARLSALWPEIVGAEAAAMTHPVRLAPARGIAGPLLTLAVSGANAPQVQMMLPALRDRINAVLGPVSVGRIALVQGGGPMQPPAPRTAPRPPPPLGAMEAPLSSIGDADLRAALQTLARNVLSRAGNDTSSGR